MLMHARCALDCSTGHGMPVREEASGGVAVGAVRLQSGWQAESHRYSSHLPGETRLMSTRTSASYEERDFCYSRFQRVWT